MEISLIGRGVRMIILVSIAINVILASEMSLPVRVSRRLSGDIYWYSSDDFESCHDNPTYLISEDRCVNDQELFNGNADTTSITLRLINFISLDCGFGFVSNEAPSYLTTSLIFRQNGSIILFKQLKTVDASSDAAVAIINGTRRLVNGSLCQIASLEVYRGRDQIIEISHDGLSLSQNGNVKVKLS